VPIRIVLVAVRHPGNIGAAARAMKTMGLARLTLVAPAVFPHADATARAAGADDVLAQARLVPTLAAAVADCGLVYATSARSRSQYYPTLSPRAAAPRILAAAAGGEVALVFGTERTGLTNTELALCQALVQIPAAPGFDSLNLAQAVQILAYELCCAAGTAVLPPARDPPLAPAVELERLYAHLEAVLKEVDFTDRNGGPHLLGRLQRVFARAELDQHEVNILRGVLAAVQSRRRRAGAPP
jgi:TrmH family RNA methyltransferase